MIVPGRSGAVVPCSEEPKVPRLGGSTVFNVWMRLSHGTYGSLEQAGRREVGQRIPGPGPRHEVADLHAL